MKDALETEEKPKAVLLKKRCEAFIDCISHGGFSSESTSDDEGIISLDFSGPNYIKSIIDSCTLYCYNKMNLDFEAIESITKDLEYTSFNIGFDLFNCERFVNNQKLSLKDFHDSLLLYNQGINEMEQNICSVFGKLSGVSDGISKFGSNCAISPNGDVDGNKVKKARLKDPKDLTDEEKELLEYVKNIGEGNYIVNIAATTVDINQFTDGGKRDIELLYMDLDDIEEKHGLYDSITGLVKLEDYDEAMNETWDKIDAIIADESTDARKAEAKTDGRVNSVISGALQAFGGGTEMFLGKKVLL